MPELEKLETIFKRSLGKARNGFFADILAAIEDVANIPELMTDGVPNWTVAIQLVAQLATGTPQVDGAALKRKVRTVVSRRLGVTGDDLRARLTEWLAATKADLAEELPDELRPMVSKLSDLTEVWHLPIEIAKGARVDLVDGLPLDIDASAGAHFAVESLEPTQLTPPLDLGPNDADRVLRFVLAGNYRVGAAAEGMAGLFGISAGANRSAGINYRYLYAQRADALLVEALAATAHSIPSPFSLQQIGLAGTRRLSELRFTAFGKVGAEVSISASHAFTGVLGKVGGEELPLSGGLALSFMGNYRREGDFTLRAIPDDDGWVTVLLRQHRVSEGATRLGFEAGVTVRNVDNALLPLMEKYLPGTEAVNELLGELSEPGTWIRETLQDKLELSGDLGKRAKDALLADDKLVSGVLGQALESAVDLSGVDVSGNAAAEAKKVLDRFRSQLPLGADLSSDIAADLSIPLVGAINRYVGELDKAVEQRGRQTLDRLKGALKALDAPEESLDKFLDGADEQAAELLVPVKKLVARYQELRGRLAEAISDNAQVSLSLELVRTWKSLESEGAELEVRLNPAKALAKRIHRQLMFGDLTGLIRAVREKPAQLSDAVEVKSGLLSESLAEESSVAVNIGVLNKKLSMKTFARSGVTVIKDLGGRVMLVSGEAKVEKEAKWRGEEQRVGFLNELTMAARAAEPGKRLISMGRVNLSYSDQDMERDELEAYLESVSDAGLIAQVEVDAMRARYATLAASMDGKVRAVVELVMALSPNIFSKAARKDAAEIRRVALNAIWNLTPRNRSAEAMKNLANSLGPTQNGPDNLLQLPAIERPPRKIRDAIETRMSIPSTSPLSQSARRLAFMVQLAKKFADGVLSLHALTEMDPASDNFARRAKSLQEEIIEDLGPWLDADVFGLIFDKGVPRRNLAFLTALAHLAGVEEPLIGNIREA